MKARKPLSFPQRAWIILLAWWWMFKSAIKDNRVVRWLRGLPPFMPDDLVLVIGELEERAMGDGPKLTKEDVLDAFMRCPPQFRQDFLDSLENFLMVAGLMRLFNPQGNSQVPLSSDEWMLWGIIDYLRKKTGTLRKDQA
jgi:hypothetical protein